MTLRVPPKDFGFGEDEEMLRDVARKFLDDNLPVQKLRTLVAEDPDAHAAGLTMLNESVMPLYWST